MKPTNRAQNIIATTSAVMIALLLTTTTSFAQLGLQVGWNTSGYKLVRSGVHEERAWNWGVNAGILYRTPGKLICAQPTLLYTQKGATNNNNGSTYVTGISHFKNKLNYVEVSVPVLFKVPIAGPKNTFDMGVGPYWGSIVAAVSKAKDLDGNTKTTKFKIGNATTDDFKRRDLGLSFYMGTRFTHFNMALGYDLGLTNVAANKNETMKNGCFSINIGVFF